VAVLLMIPDAGLAELIASPVLIAQVWPGAVNDVMLLVHVLRMSGPSLAEVLALGLLTLLTPPVTGQVPPVELAYDMAVLRAVARSEDGKRVTEPHLRMADVFWLEVADIAVSGRSGLRMAG